MINQTLKCHYPCNDTNKDLICPRINIDPSVIKIIMISEAPPANRADYFYQKTDGAFFQTTKMVFQDAGIMINSYDDLTKMGVYLTTAIKCCKTGYLVAAQTIKECSKLLESELAQFPNVMVIMCMGDFAIRAINYIYKNKYQKAPIKSGSTYKIRKEEHVFNNVRFFPSYTQTGDSFNIEKSKRQMIATDIKKALEYIKNGV